MGLANDAQNLENAGKEKDYDQIRAGHGDYVNKFNRLIEILNQFLNKQKESQDSGVIAESWLVGEAIAQIRESAKNKDYKAIENIYKDMSGYIIPDDTRSLWEQVKEAFESMHYEKIESLLK